MSADFTLERDAFGRLILTDAAGRAHTGVAAVRAFPIHAPEEGISLLDADGHECAWIARLADLPPAARALVTEALEQREFMPAIQRVLAVSSFATPKGEEDIRRLGADLLIISDAHGVQYLIRKLQDMDRQSRKLLDRFL